MKNHSLLFFRSVSKTIDIPFEPVTQLEQNTKRFFIAETDMFLYDSLNDQIGKKYQYDIVHAKVTGSQLIQYLDKLPAANLPHAIICGYRYFYEFGGYQLGLMLKKQQHTKHIPFIVVARPLEVSDEMKAGVRLQQTGVVDDFYIMPFSYEMLLNRIDYLTKFKTTDINSYSEEEGYYPYKMPFGKRLFDIVFATVALLFLSPVMLLIALLIKIESRGPVLYKSKRVGEGYHIFDFYKFRSMSQTADKELTALAHLNQYATEKVEKNEKISFVKISNDPRVTKVGWLIRKTSLDELPQLINVLMGDMSIVGNRPLPLYEAQQLTRDVWAKRFLAPAGITGLWQVTKRGHSNMSAEERIALDNTYAQNCSFLMDMSIVLRTLPAMLQREAV